MLAFVHSACPTATVLLLALAVLEHHRPVWVAALFRAAPDQALRSRATLGAIFLITVATLFVKAPGGFAAVAGETGEARLMIENRLEIDLRCEVQQQAGIEIAAARGHDEAFERRKAHRGIERPPAIDRRGRAAAAEL